VTEWKQRAFDARHAGEGRRPAAPKVKTFATFLEEAIVSLDALSREVAVLRRIRGTAVARAKMQIEVEGAAAASVSPS